MSSPFPALVCAAVACAAAPAVDFSYDRAANPDIQVVKIEKRGGVEIRDLTFANLKGGRTAAYHVIAPGAGKAAAVLYVHWYEPPHPTSNRTQYLDEAVAMAAKGQTSLLIETPWSDPVWFEKKRQRKDDLAFSVHQVKELRRALDVLLADPRVDPARVAYVGHDFGAMYGAVLASVDDRPKVWALQAGTPRFSDWFLYGPPKLEGAEKQRFIDELAPVDPVTHIGKAKGPILFQFATKDFHVPKPRAEEFIAAAPDPKEVKWYEGGHGLVPAATEDRKLWLADKLKLR